jgi:signal peptidase I
MIAYRRGNPRGRHRAASDRRWLLAGTRAVGVGLLRLTLGWSLLLLLTVGIGPHTGWYQTLTVLSGSMHPAFEPGDLVIATPESPGDVTVGQVIIYEKPLGDHETISHRVVWVQHEGAEVLIRTRGDANNATDPWTARISAPKVWQVQAAAPRLGYVLAWFRDLPLRKFAPYLGAGMLALWFIVRLWRPTRRPGTPVDEPSPAGPAS